MGTWDAGNFDSDGALDYVGDLIDQLTRTITTCFNENDAGLDEGGESRLMPSVAIIKLLSDNCGAAPPKPNVIVEWQNQYLAIYDSQIDDLEPKDEYEVKRRNIINQTFTELVDLSRQFWRD